jgi:hypothetical protein
MVKNFGKVKVAVLAICLLSALAFLLNHLSAGRTSSAVLENGNKPSPGAPVKEIENYRSWTKVNPTPQLMPKPVATACAIWMSDKGIQIDGQGNPHRDKYLTVYVNDVGRRAMLGQKRPKFPQGSVIVKEKLPAKDSHEPELLTVMIKQKQGFNPANGDWEYMVVNGTGTKVEGRGRLQNCQACHEAYQKNDYIFRTYLPQETASRLK